MARTNVPPSLERINELVAYCPGTGEIRWKVSTARTKAGDLAGYKGANGYIELQIDRYRTLAHRLAWFLMKGQWPICQIDHWNRDRADNRWENLRECSQTENQANTVAYKNNRFGVKGVYRSKNCKKFYSKIQVYGKNIYLGVFQTPEEAQSAYWEAARSHYGEWARKS
jgi:hypothetical protein